MNPDEFNEMTQYEQVLELSFLCLQGVGDEHDNDMVLWNMPIEECDSNATFDFANFDPDYED